MEYLYSKEKTQMEPHRPHTTLAASNAYIQRPPQRKMSNLRFVRFDNPKTFLEDTKQADDYLMKNSGAISIADYRNGPTNPSRVFYLAIYRGEALL